MSIDFYTNLRPIHSLVDITDPANFVPVPGDWYVAVTDVKGSTKAIEAGRYRDINLLSASTIVGILNVTKGTEIPFIFGGDGATLLIPPNFLEVTQKSLVSTKNLAQKVFNLDLRVGVIPVYKITEACPMLIAKLAISPFYDQAILRGGGVSYAEKLIKQEETAYLYQLSAGDDCQTADYTGLECRWQDIKSPRGETISLIIQTMSNQPDRVYREVIEAITTICGNEDYFRPVTPDRLNLSFSYSKLNNEAKVFEGNSGGPRLFYLIAIWLGNILGFILLKLKVRNQAADWGNYPHLLVSTTDYKKFDDGLRMVIACTTEQRIKLQEYLQGKYEEQMLCFGIHTSDRALMTCLVFERSGRQVHFIDSADGGYALAAKQMKAQIRALSDRDQSQNSSPPTADPA